jgi:hypothetical protein
VAADGSERSQTEIEMMSFQYDSHARRNQSDNTIPYFISRIICTGMYQSYVHCNLLLAEDRTT